MTPNVSETEHAWCIPYFPKVYSLSKLSTMDFQTYIGISRMDSPLGSDSEILRKKRWLIQRSVNLLDLTVKNENLLNSTILKTQWAHTLHNFVQAY